MNDFERFREFFKSMGVPFSTDAYDGYDNHYIPKSIQTQVRYTMWAFDASLVFDSSMTYLGAVVGDEQPSWDPRYAS